jgi:hypothetical protein
MASFSNRELRDAMREMSVEPAGVKETVTDRLDSAKDTLLKASQGLKTQLAEARLGEKGANALRSASAVSASAAAAASAQMQRLKVRFLAADGARSPPCSPRFAPSCTPPPPCDCDSHGL